MSETFDTLAAAQTLRNKGMDSGHAEGVVEVVRNAQSELATKADIEGVNDRIDALGENMRTEMKALNDRFDAVNDCFDAVNGRFDAVNGRIDSLGESLRTEIKALGGRIDTMRWLIGLNFTATMAAIAAIVVVAITLAAQ